ncbi:MAG: HepT-like ribonuclease domain-containing protein [bacterium]
MPKEQKIQKLTDYFQKRQDVEMAFLFGSQSTGRERVISDWDIGIYLKPKHKELEWESEQEYAQKNQIWSDIEKIAKTEVDLVVLNSAPCTLVFDILRKGKLLALKNRSIYLSLLARASYEAIDFRNFIRDFYAIKQRSASLSEADKTNILKILDFLETEMKDFAKFKKVSWQDYLKSRDVKRNIERWIENIVNASLDIAKILLASENQEIPDTYREILEKLGIINSFDLKNTKKLAQWARLRNVLAHQYLDLRWKRVQKFTAEAQKDFEYLAEKVREKITPI